MTRIDAIFQGGVFKPLEPVNLPENERVQLEVVKPVPEPEIPAWAERARRLRQKLFERHGYFPDIALEIREDRERDD
jgi:predicted DNA-binding antitoxin AbrB/MazE fold protein